MIPRATYRIQLTPTFGFDALRAALPYLQELGISHLYLSPVFKARPGSEHGYDVTDHAQLNPELGGEPGFAALAGACRERGMGMVLDIVPNHMAVMTADNLWWVDVLRHGRASRFASYFDIDWSPARGAMRNRLLVPVLAEPLGEIIDRQELRLVFDSSQGIFSVEYSAQAFPLDPGSYPRLFNAIAARGLPELAPEAATGWWALHAGFAALPSARDELIADPRREAGARGLSRTLASLCEAHPLLARHITESLEQFSRTSQERNANLLASLLAAQPFRLAFWRVSGEEINYRRFFDVNQLAALRAEDREVFDATHTLVARLWRTHAIDGLRVDHADGLAEPARYFERLRGLLAETRASSPPWIVAEKILASGEKLPADWSVDGTTGYEFATLCAAWLMNPAGAAGLERTWRRFAGSAPAYPDVARECRRLAMRSALAAEISGLASRLDRLAQMHRNTQDFTLFDLRQAIVEVIASFPVYRTYINGGRPTPEDAQYIRRAVGGARFHKTATPRALDFLESVLLGELAEDAQRAATAREFVLKFQQVTAPVMAKGIEDTACYRHACFLAMNEVGGDPLSRGIGTEALHRANESRLRETPRAMLATSTHDTKRGEDPRARLCVLSELAGDWAACASRWRSLKSRRRNAAPVGGVQEYLLLQTLLSIWPSDPALHEPDALRQRMQEYAIKSAREAKASTSWLEPDAEYERVLRAYVGVLLPERIERGFRRYFEPVLDRVLYFGLLNSLVTVVLKFTVPGVPDIYQGNELPALVLVDPDNRHTPDHEASRAALQRLRAEFESDGSIDLLRRCLRDWRQGQLKLYLTWRLLELRRQQPGFFEAADYMALEVQGEQAAHLCAFARRSSDSAIIVLVSRWGATLAAGALEMPVGEAWRDTRVLLNGAVPAGRYADMLGGCFTPVDIAAGSGVSLDVGKIFGLLPFCVLVPGNLAIPLEQQQ